MRRASLTLAAIVLLTLVPSAQGRRVLLSASCGPSCVPKPRPFRIDPGWRAEGFRVGSLRAGSYCANRAKRFLAGFSIRRGSDTLYIYYIGPAGPVSDPVPLEDLILPPGAYTLRAAPARGASVSLSYVLVPAQAARPGNNKAA